EQVAAGHAEALKIAEQVQVSKPSSSNGAGPHPRAGSRCIRSPSALRAPRLASGVTRASPPRLITSALVVPQHFALRARLRVSLGPHSYFVLSTEGWHPTPTPDHVCIDCPSPL